MSLTRKKLSEEIGKKPNTIYRYEKDGKAPVYPVKLEYNGELRYPDDAVSKYQEWMRKRRGESSEE